MKIDQKIIFVGSSSYLRRKVTTLKDPKSTHLDVDISSDIYAYQTAQ